MKLRHAERIIEWCEDNDLEARIYEGYSGKFMYGAETTAIIVKSPEVVGLAIGRINASIEIGVGSLSFLLEDALAELSDGEVPSPPEDEETIPEGFRVDNFAREFVVY